MSGRLLDEDGVPVAADGTPDMEADEWNAYLSAAWWQVVEQLNAARRPVHIINLDSRRDGITSFLALVGLMALVWITCLLLYAGGLWIAGLL